MASMHGSYRKVAETDQLVATADSAILDRCRRWFNLARAVVTRRIPTARVVAITPSPPGRGPG